MAVERLLKVTEVAGVLGVTRGQVYELIRTGRLPSVNLGKRQTRVRPNDLDALLREMAGRGNPGKDK